LKLSEVSKVSLATIQRAEKGNGDVPVTPANAQAIQRALEDAGVEFINDAGSAGVSWQEPGL